jgi:regulator of protease activity HflC (stomatin/prohibitin superfamily)
MNPIGIALSLLFGAAAAAFFAEGLRLPAAALLIIAIILLYALKMARQWEKAVVLRAGKLDGVYGPGLFFIIPVVDNIAAWIDQRIQTTAVNAEQALTKDTVPVNVDAIIFWVVHDTERAALEITDYKTAIQRVAQTSLREMIGASALSELLSDRLAADEKLKEEIGRKTAEWGITVNSVEIRDVAIPAALQDAMSRQAQAEREKQARVILGSAEEEVAKKFVEAARLYSGNLVALQLRAMNIVYETTKERGATILMPTSMVDAMNPGSIMGLASLVQSTTATAPKTPTP